MSGRYLAPGAVEHGKLDDLKDDTLYTCRLFCSDCHTQVNETKPMSKGDLQQNWVLLVMGSGFTTGACPSCGASTFSDLNIHTDLNIFLYDGDEAWQERDKTMRNRRPSHDR